VCYVVPVGFLWLRLCSTSKNSVLIINDGVSIVIDGLGTILTMVKKYISKIVLNRPKHLANLTRVLPIVTIKNDTQFVPKISVIIPVYGHAEYVVEALESVFSQSYTDFEVIVVNDGSPDASETVLSPYIRSGQIRYILQENQGVAAARNHGLSLSTGEYVAFLDDDDVWPRDKLAAQVEQIENSDAVMVGGTYQVLAACDSLQVAQSCSKYEFQVLKTLDFFLGNPFASPGQVLIRKSALHVIGGYDEAVWGVDDLDLWIRLSRVGEIRKYDDIALFYRVHETNASSNLEKMAVNTELVIRQNLRAIPAEERQPFENAGYHFLFRYAGKKLVWKGAKCILAGRREAGWGMIKYSFSVFQPRFRSDKRLLLKFVLAVIKIPFKVGKVR
jgi:glycosyltransferase involved in cell wall biosynthesis